MSRLKILVVNAKGRKGSGAWARRHFTAQVVDNVKPNVIFFQELEENDWKYRHFLRHLYLVHDNDEAFVVTNLPRSEAQKKTVKDAYADIITEMTIKFKKLSLSEGSSPVDISYFELPRLSCFVIDGKWLCASWHGRYTGFPGKSKQEALRSLLHFLIRLKDDVRLPFILGADFNMKSLRVREVVWEFREHGLKLYDADDKYEEKVMVIVSGEITADGAPIIHGETELLKKDRTLDHLQLVLTLSTSVTFISNALLQFDLNKCFISQSPEHVHRLLYIQAIHMMGALKRFTSLVRENVDACRNKQEALNTGKTICQETINVNSQFLQMLDSEY